MAPEEVRAAGGIVRRGAGAGDGVEVLVVHRPRYDDWSFPKGKCDPGETFEQTARREVHEETGLTVALGDVLGDVRYRDRKDRPKVVRYWAMTVVAGSFAANDEVDEARWMTVGEATALLTYEHDRDLLVGTLSRL